MKTKSFFYMKLKLILFLMVICASACSQDLLRERRLKTMTEIVKSLSAKDTVKLYGLIDTSFIIPIISSDNFTPMVQELCSIFSRNKIEIHDNDFKVRQGEAGTTVYKVEFLLNNDKDFKYVILTFHFNPHEWIKAFDFGGGGFDSKIDDTPFQKGN